MHREVKCSMDIGPRQCCSASITTQKKNGHEVGHHLLADYGGPHDKEDYAMKRLQHTAGLLIGFGLSLSMAYAAAPAKPLVAPAVKTAPSTGAVDPDATRAMERMSAYLMSLPAFEIKADTVRDLVTNDGQRVQIGGVSRYKVHRPNGFQISVDTDMMSRQYYFDGKQFTVFSPKLDFYATVSAPPTIHETLDVLRTKFGVEVPLEDVFLWNDPSIKRAERLKSAYLVGPATIDGIATDHYAFREADRDWEIWIEKGDKPFPHKLVITDTSDSAHPSYAAHLTWNGAPALIATDFTFKPGANAKAIHIAKLDK